MSEGITLSEGDRERLRKFFTEIYPKLLRSPPPPQPPPPATAKRLGHPNLCCCPGCQEAKATKDAVKDTAKDAKDNFDKSRGW
jgi:hypothetical protein